MVGSVLSGIKISQAVAASNTANNNTVNIYTCPAESYAILNVTCTGAAVAGWVKIGNYAVASIASGATFPAFGSTDRGASMTVYLGPSQVLKVTSNGAGNVSVDVTGVEFINTP